MAAANTVMENGGKVVLLDKSAFCGGNSTKATSGIFFHQSDFGLLSAVSTILRRVVKRISLGPLCIQTF